MHSNDEFVNEICKFVFSSFERLILLRRRIYYLLVMIMVCRFYAVVLLCKHFTWTMKYTFFGHYVEYLNIFSDFFVIIIIWKSLRRLWSAHVQFGQWSTCLQMEQLKYLIPFGAIWIIFIVFKNAIGCLPTLIDDPKIHTARNQISENV